VGHEIKTTVRTGIQGAATVGSELSPSLDDLEKSLTVLTERCKSDLKSAATPDERSRILTRYRILIKNQTDDLLSRMH